jgi:predicted O-methyltransferase YrrM
MAPATDLDRRLSHWDARTPRATLAGVSAPTEVPGVVARALSLSHRQGFMRSSRNETGRLLAALAASRPGTLAELGTGCGVGTAWLLSGKRDDAVVVTAEVDPKLAVQVQALFQDESGVEVVSGDWTVLAAHAPFSLLFVDARDAKESVDAVADLIEPGGMVVLDDFTPSTHWPPIYEGRVDSLREQWLTDERFTSVEVMVTDDSSVVLATRR